MSFDPIKNKAANKILATDINNETTVKNVSGTGDVVLQNNSDLTGTTGVENLEATGTVTLSGNPTTALQAAPKQYVDALIQGLDVKYSVRVATTTALPAVTYNNGTSGLGATLTADANGALPSQDGVSLSVNDRILIKDQVSGLQNGIYEVTQIGDGSNPFILTRTEDADNSPSGGEVTPGMFTYIEEGTMHSDSGWVLTTNGTITIGTTALVFSQFSGAGQITAGDGLTKSGNTLNVVTADSGRIVVNADNIDLATTGVGAGTFTKFTVDLYGRITNATSILSSDITSALGFTPLKNTTDTFTGVLTLTGSQTISSTLEVSGIQTNNSDLVFTSAISSIRMDTIDGSDNKVLTIFGGGAGSGTRGAGIQLYGNEHASLPGVMRLIAGDITGSSFQIYTGSAERFNINQAGDANFIGKVIVTATTVGIALDVQNPSGNNGIRVRSGNNEVNDGSEYVLELRNGTSDNQLMAIHAGGYSEHFVTDNLVDGWVVKQGSNNYLHIKTTNGAESVTLGNTTTNPIVRILGGTGATAGLRLQTNETDATNKEGRVKAAHYTNAEEPVTMMWISSTVSANALYIGGNSSAENAVTSIDFLTAATNTTINGTRRGGFNSTGHFDVVAGASVFQLFDVYGVGNNGAVNYERIRIQHDSNFAYIQVEAGGTGVQEALKIQTGGATRYQINNTGTVHQFFGVSSFSSTLTTDGLIYTKGNLRISTGSIDIQPGDTIGKINFYSEDLSSGASGERGRIEVVNDFAGNWDGTPARWDTNMGFYVAVDGVETLALRLSSSLLATFSGAVSVASTLTMSSDIIFSTTNGYIRQNTSDGSDTGAVSIVGGGTISTLRGAYVRAFGNENVGDPGILELAAGNITGGKIRFHAAGDWRYETTSTGGHSFLSEVGMSGIVTISGASNGVEANQFIVVAADIDSKFTLGNNTSNSIDLNYTRSDGAIVLAINGHTMETTFGGEVTLNAEKLNLGGVNNNAVINAAFSMYFNIDSDNNSVIEKFQWGFNGNTTGATVLMSLTETGVLALTGSQTISSNLTVSGGTLHFGANTAADRNLIINSNSSTTRDIRFMTTEASRWSLQASSTTESGSDTGTNFLIGAYNDAGTLIDYPFEITRAASGLITMTRSVSMTSNLSVTGVVGFGAVATSTIALNVNNSALTGTTQHGIVSQSTFTSSATAFGRAINAQVKTAAASFTLAEAVALFVDVTTKGAGSTITNLYGLKIENQTQGDTNYAIHTGLGLVRFGTDNIIISTSKTPASASDTGTQGMVAWDADYVYVCVATNTWKRSAIVTWV